MIDFTYQILEKRKIMDLIQIGIIIAAVGFAFAAIGTISFKVRAIANKKSWGGPTAPCLIGGFAIMIIGVLLIALGYK